MGRIRMKRAAHGSPEPGRSVFYPRGWEGLVPEHLEAKFCDQDKVAVRIDEAGSPRGVASAAASAPEPEPEEPAVAEPDEDEAEAEAGEDEADEQDPGRADPFTS